MLHTIVVVRAEKKGEWQILYDYIKRGATLRSIAIANDQATKLFQAEACDHLILAREEV